MKSPKETLQFYETDGRMILRREPSHNHRGGTREQFHSQKTVLDFPNHTVEVVVRKKK